MDRVTDQKVLVHILKNRDENDKDDSVRLAAARRVTDQSALADIVNNDTNTELVVIACERLDPTTSVTRADLTALLEAHHERMWKWQQDMIRATTR